MPHTPETVPAADAVLAALRAGETVGVEALTGVVRRAQEAMNVWSGVQLLALAQLAATEDVVVDGVPDEQFRGLGHVRLDAAALVPGELGLTDAGAAQRVALGVRLSTAAPAVLGAVTAGVVDAWRASVVVRELAEVPVPVCRQVTDEVVASLGESLSGIPAGRLRVVTRRVLGRVAPDLVAASQERARMGRELRRWCDVEGQDVWEVRLGQEQARPAFAAVEAKAAQLRRVDPSLSVGQSRADGLVALVLGGQRRPVRGAVGGPGGPS